MKDALRTRIEFLWAKLAGRDVDINTLTPDAPTNMVEKLMLETADRIAGSSGGGSSGSGNMVLDLDNLPKPMLDGVEIEEIVLSPEGEENVAYPTTYVFMCDCSGGSPPPIVKTSLGHGSFTYTMIPGFETDRMFAAITSEEAEERICLLNDVDFIMFDDISENSILLLPTTAQFGIRKADVVSQ